MTARRRLDQQLFSHMILESIGEGFIVRCDLYGVDDRLRRLLHGPVASNAGVPYLCTIMYG